MKIKLNNEIGIDLEKLISGKLLVQANSGGGKSWLIRRLIEQAHGKVQIIILDPEGEFSTLREKYEFVLAGKGGDIPTESKSAALLARKTLEHGYSLIADLYELPPQERKHFVKLFLEAMVNAPKELYHNVLVVLDEAHMFVPEKDESEAAGTVIDMASRGRKRGYSLVLATQRISKLAKDAAAECNNKLIGRTSLDIDRKRAADELGITSKEEILALRTLAPGEFFAFGPAISNEVIKIKVGDVETSIPKAGQHFKVAPPTEAIKKVLAKLVDLPQEAKREADTMQSLKSENSSLKRENQMLKNKPPEVVTSIETIQKAVKTALAKKQDDDLKFESNVLAENKKYIGVLEDVQKRIAKVILDPRIFLGNRKLISEYIPQEITPQKSEKRPYIPREKVLVDPNIQGEITGPEQRVLNAIAWCESIGLNEPSNEITAFLSGYSHPKSTGYTNPRGYLKAKGMVQYSSGTVSLTESGRVIAEIPETPLTQDELHRIVLDKLDGPERKLLKPLLERYPEGISNEELCNLAGYMHEKSTGYTNPRGRLKSFGLIEYENGTVKAKQILFIN